MSLRAPSLLIPCMQLSNIAVSLNSNNITFTEIVTGLTLFKGLLERQQIKQKLNLSH